MWFRKYENWNVNSLSLPPPSTEFMFRFAEWNLLALVPHDWGALRGEAPYTWLLSL
jgi:hypothetical protein